MNHHNIDSAIKYLKELVTTDELEKGLNYIAYKIFQPRIDEQNKVLIPIHNLVSFLNECKLDEKVKFFGDRNLD